MLKNDGGREAVATVIRKVSMFPDSILMSFKDLVVIRDGATVDCNFWHLFMVLWFGVLCAAGSTRQSDQSTVPRGSVYIIRQLNQLFES